jgi:hypothetical protein
LPKSAIKTMTQIVLLAPSDPMLFVTKV